MTLQEHPLAWRWIDPKYSRFPDHVLAGMHPVSREESADLFPCTDSSFLQILSNAQNDELLIRDSTHDSPDAIRRWLRDQQSDTNVEVLITWSSWTIGIRTIWEVFTERWDDFCYPASDDVVVRPRRGRWLLVYTHDEVFQFVGNTKSVTRET